MTEGTLNMGTLHYWAKNDNPEKYKEIVKASHSKKDVKDEDDLLSFTDYGLAKVMYKKIKDEFACVSINDKWVWFHFVIIYGLNVGKVQLLKRT
jgi:hypothetical protein